MTAAATRSTAHSIVEASPRTKAFAATEAEAESRDDDAAS